MYTECKKCTAIINKGLHAAKQIYKAFDSNCDFKAQNKP